MTGMRSMQEDGASPGGDWVHAFEEDHDGLQVFRPARGFAFPPARRGRARLRFSPDGGVALERPGPDDRPVAVPLEALGMGRYRAAAGGPAFEIVERQADRMLVRGLSP